MALGCSERYRIFSTADINAGVIKTGGTTLGTFDLGNTGASDAFLKLYDKATAPNPATDTPLATIYLPKGTRQVNPPDLFVRVYNGLAITITGGVADADATAVLAHQITGLITYE
jgi:hypothetical protein